MASTDTHAYDPQALRAWLRLQLTPGVSHVYGYRLLRAFGLPENVFVQNLSALRTVVPDRQAMALLQEPAELNSSTDTLLQWIARGDGTNRVITLGDSDYPESLLHISDPPLMLYVQGSDVAWRELVRAPCMAIVGSRNPTAQGAENAAAFAFSLAQSGLSIVSGLALGIDAAAHRGALRSQENALPTIAVVGTGLDRVYPAAHTGLATEIATRGLVISEYPLGTPPLQAHFPRRNRLISGLSCATLVVEAAMRSGSLITAQQALEQGRDVFAIPGSIHSTQAKGCHALIKQGAQLVDCIQDILDATVFQKHVAVPAMNPNKTSEAFTSQTPSSATETHTLLLDALAFDPCSLESLQNRTGWDTARLQSQLMELELSGLIGRMPGGLFQRLQRNLFSASDHPS